jgi:DNA polymerase III sliding clamp (beta) subunit (PCNA family)
LKRSLLLEALKQVMPGVEENAVVFDIANAVMFDGSWVKTFNDSISVSYPFESEIKCLVKAKELFAVINKGDSEEIRMVMLDGGKLQISGGRTTLKMTTLDRTKFISLVDNLSLSDAVWNPLPEDFCTGLRFCCSFSANNSAYAALCGVSIATDGLAASDGRKAAIYHFPKDSFCVEEEFVLPVKAVVNLVKVAGLKEYSMVGGWVHFRNEAGVCFSTRRIDTEFPREQINGYLNFSGLGVKEEYQFPAGLAKSIERASVLSFSDEVGSDYVEISLDKKGNMIVSGGKEFGEIKEKIAKGEWSFPDGGVIKVNPKVFVDMLHLNQKFFLKNNKFLLMRTGSLDSVLALVA